MKLAGFTDTEIDQFLRYQRLSFAIQRSVIDTLHDGITEREVAKQLFSAYRAEGVRGYFHLPVVLFGERTALPDPWTVLGFWPTDRALQPGDAVILDASPIFDDYLVDTSAITSPRRERHARRDRHRRQRVPRQHPARGAVPRHVSRDRDRRRRATHRGRLLEPTREASRRSTRSSGREAGTRRRA